MPRFDWWCSDSRVDVRRVGGFLRHDRGGASNRATGPEMMRAIVIGHLSFVICHLLGTGMLDGIGWSGSSAALLHFRPGESEILDHRQRDRRNRNDGAHGGRPSAGSNTASSSASFSTSTSSSKVLQTPDSCCSGSGNDVRASSCRLQESFAIAIPSCHLLLASGQPHSFALLGKQAAAHRVCARGGRAIRASLDESLRNG